MAPFYTGKGDKGETGFLGEGRISKTSLRIEAVGTVDEATAALGLARSLAESDITRTVLLAIQKQLYWLMTELSADPEIADQFDKLGQAEVAWLEAQISVLEERVEMPQAFIIPGQTPASGALALARTIIRRAERRTVGLLEAGEIRKVELVAYLNRLSSLIFILEVHESSLAGGSVQLAKEA